MMMCTMFIFTKMTLGMWRMVMVTSEKMIMMLTMNDVAVDADGVVDDDDYDLI